jgi:hypothetical protein
MVSDACFEELHLFCASLMFPITRLNCKAQLVLETTALEERIGEMNRLHLASCLFVSSYAELTCGVRDSEGISKRTAREPWQNRNVEQSISSLQCPAIVKLVR